MKALTTFIAIALLAFSTTACSQQHTYRSGGFGSKTVKASKNYVTKDIKVDNFTKLSVAGSPDVTYTQKSGKPTVEVYTGWREYYLFHRGKAKWIFGTWML